MEIFHRKFILKYLLCFQAILSLFQYHFGVHSDQSTSYNILVFQPQPNSHFRTSRVHADTLPPVLLFRRNIFPISLYPAFSCCIYFLYPLQKFVTQVYGSLHRDVRVALGLQEESAPGTVGGQELRHTEQRSESFL